MSLKDYVKKGKPALWLRTFPSQASAAVRPWQRAGAERQKKANWTTVAGAVAVAEPAERKRVRRQSKVSRKASAGYAAKAAAFVAAAVAAGGSCPVVRLVPELRDGFKYGHHISARLHAVHHVYGRGHGGRGPLLMDERLWICLSLQGHRWVHSHQTEARALGFLAPLGQWNVPVPADAAVLRLPGGGLRVELAAGNAQET